jgi:AAA domain-containing protein/bifunctional DNA primase/polymerase-like protein
VTVADRERDAVAVSREIQELFNMRGPLIRVRGKSAFDHGWQSDPARWPTLWEAKLSDWRHELGIPMGLRRDGAYNVALDFDDYKPGAADSRARLFDLGLPRRTVTQLTPRGGEHYFFVSPVPIRSRPLDAEGYPGVDVKCEGGYVVFYDDWETGWGPLDCPFALIDPCDVLDVLVGARPARATSAPARLGENERVIALLEEHFGAHGTRWTGSYYVTTRPGKDASDGHSATVGAIAEGVAHNFSGSWNGLPAGTFDRRELCRVRGLRDPIAAALQEIADGIPRRGGRHVQTLAEFMARVPAMHDWLVPGLIERGDRMLLTAGGGVGKSTLLRQLACGAALGMNALSDAPWEVVAPPIRSLLIDLENTERQLRREFLKVERIVGPAAFEAIAALVRMEPRSEGLVLDLDTRAWAEDREWLAATIEGARPDLVVIGPLYKMQGGRPNDEESSRDLAKFLDRLRVKFGFALIIEAHTAKAVGEQRPSGSSTWLRWPEFGIYLAVDGALHHWRGQREERNFPTALARTVGEPVPGEWLWRKAVPGESGTSFDTLDPYEKRILDARGAIVRELPKAGRPLTRGEIVDLLGRQKAAVVAAIARLEREGAFIVTMQNHERGNGRPYPVEHFTIDPRGPWAPT